MEVILYLAQTVNGYIAKENDNTPWSNEEFVAYYLEVKMAKNLIVGNKTYKIMKESDEFRKCNNPTIVVVSKSHPVGVYGSASFVKSPGDAIDLLKSKGFKKIIIGGGSVTAYSFMKLGLVDKLYIDVEPLMFGNGVPFLFKGKLESKLELTKLKKLSKNTLQLQYRILR
jgi:dihydrofolate reductase